MADRETVNLTLRLPRSLHEQLREVANAQDSSINRELVLAVRSHIRFYTKRGSK